MFPNDDRPPGIAMFRETDTSHKAVLMFGLIAPILTFALAVSSLSVEIKTATLVTLAATYIGICLWSFRKNSVHKAPDDNAVLPVPHSHEVPDVPEKLRALDEANAFFGSSLKPADMFRLLASRVGEIFPFASAVLWVAEEDGSALVARYTTGNAAQPEENASVSPDAGLPGRAFKSGKVRLGPLSEIETGDADERLQREPGYAAAIPLSDAGKVFAVFEIFSDEDLENDASVPELLEAIGSRIGPLILSSIAMERSLSNALTDPLTGLPNERALFMILENQLAESHRYKDERPLSVLALDLKGFDEINQRYGHATGDNMLRHAAATMREALRRMDFLARIHNDEFVIVLPTASDKMAADVAGRLSELFADNPYEISEHEEIKLWLNIGSATFWKDGESIAQLLGAARLRKLQAKSERPGNVLWFGKEYVN